MPQFTVNSIENTRQVISSELTTLTPPMHQFNIGRLVADMVLHGMRVPCVITVVGWGVARRAGAGVCDVRGRRWARVL